MTRIFTTEITSEAIPSDNPIHQRLFKAYVVAKDYVKGDVLEVGCGEGRGIATLTENAASFTAVDKIGDVIRRLQAAHPAARLISMNIPPLKGLDDNRYDLVVSFQVIEHIQDDALFLKEIHRVLKPGGTALISTPNRAYTLSRNPWHIREYLPDELARLGQRFFRSVELKGIAGNAKVMAYYEENKKSVRRIMRWDVLNLQHRLPAPVLRLPYELLNRFNRNKLQAAGSALVRSIRHEDYMLTDNAAEGLDLFMVLKK